MEGSERGVSLKKGFLKILFLLLFFPLSAQISEGPADDPLERQYHLDLLKSQALDAMSRGDIEQAIRILDTAIAMAPANSQLLDMRSSLMELQLISREKLPPEDESDTDKPEFYNPEEPSPSVPEEEENLDAPDFEEEHFAGKQFETPALYRDYLSLSAGTALGYSLPVFLDNQEFYQHQSSDERSPFYSVFGDFQYYFQGVDRALGVNIRYYGNLVNPDRADLLDHQVDLALQMRGFFRESVEARSVIGVRFGVSLLFMDEYVREDPRPALANALTFGVFYHDALFRHIFSNSVFFQKLVFDAGVNYYYLTLTENSSMIRYNGGISYEFFPDVRIGVVSRFASTDQDIQSLTSWDTGLQITYNL